MVYASSLLLLLLSLLCIAVSTERVIPFIHLAHPGYKIPVYFDEYEGLLGSDVLKMCVRREYPPVNGLQCEIPKVCLWGSQRCGSENQLQPTSRCNCKDEVWTCQPFLCPTMEPKCPAKPTLGVADTDKPICKTDLKCGYEEKTCEGCNVTVPTIQCACEAGQPFSCQQIDPCASDVKCSILQKAALAALPVPEGNVTSPLEVVSTGGDEEGDEFILFPEPVILEVKTQVPPPANFKPNDPSCPVNIPDYKNNATTPTTCSVEGTACHYGYSCCCADGSECSSDVKCVCTDGVLECKEKVCDAFLCIGPPPLLQSPFPNTELIITSGMICPPEEDALTTTSCLVSDDAKFYHCEYSFSCCCPNSPSGADFSGRFCSSDLQCTCNSGVFSCDAAACPPCPVDVDDVKCPETKPEDGSFCPNPVGETCGFGQVKCCNEKVHAESYCTCQGNGVWDCFDAAYLCDMEVC